MTSGRVRDVAVIAHIAPCHGRDAGGATCDSHDPPQRYLYANGERLSSNEVSALTVWTRSVSSA